MPQLNFTAAQINELLQSHLDIKTLGLSVRRKAGLGGFGVTALPISNLVTATTNSTGQSCSFSSGSIGVQCKNLDTANYAFIGIGDTTVDAEINAKSGIANVNRFLLAPNSVCEIPKKSKFFSWVGATQSVQIQLTQVG